MFASLCLTVVLALLGCVSAAPRLQHRQIGEPGLANVYYKCTKPNSVALTFDDGPFVYLYDVSKALVAAGAKGTFFFNGHNYGCIYDDDQIKRVKYAYTKGHQVASHTWGHQNLSSLSWDQVHDEMWRVELALQRIVGVQPAFMRPPYGEFNGMVRAAAKIRGQHLALWDFDSGDTWGIPTQDMINRYDAIATEHPDTILTLNHDTQQQSAQVVLPYAIQRLQQAGYELVTLAECLGEEPYQWVGTPQVKDATWTC